MEGKFTIIKKFRLLSLFNSQIKILKNRGCSEQITAALQSQKNSVIKKASGMTLVGSRIPFLPVVPSTLCGIPGLMAMVKHGHETGYAILNPTKIFDVAKTPKEPYYIYDVEDGELTRGKVPDIAEEIFKQQKRFPLTVAETIALCTQTSIFSWQHGMWAVGSRYESAEFTPIIIESPTGKPSLEYDRFHFAGYALRCSPSCGSR